MALGLGLDLDLSAQPPEAAVQVRERLRSNFVHEVGFVAAWKVQSWLATAAFLTLVALVQIWLALAIMMVWSLVATLVYHRARLIGLPDLFENSSIAAAGKTRTWYVGLVTLVVTLAKACVVGLQPFIYCRTLGFLVRPAKSLPGQAARLAVLWAGLTLFGVTATHHLLRRAGYSGGRLLNFGYVGTALNVPYRILISAVFVNAAAGIARF